MRNDVRELGRRGVEGREGGFTQVAEFERFGIDASMTDGYGTWFCQGRESIETVVVYWAGHSSDKVQE